jgi:adenylate kinase
MADTKRYRTILLFGAPGSGKGTQGKIIGQIPGFYHNSTGEMFRGIDLKSPIGRVFQEYAGRGELVPDEFTIKLWKQFITGKEYVNDFHPETEFLVLDGLPRNVKQAELLREVIDVAAIVYLRAERAKMVERLRRRALKENRMDDASDVVINRRMEVFGRETRPVLNLYPKEIIHRIDATMSQIRILSRIVEILVPLKETMDGDEEAASPFEGAVAPQQQAVPVETAAELQARTTG